MGVSGTRGATSCSRDMISRLLLIVAVVLAVAGAAPATARADWDDRPDPAEFEDELAPHGYWVDDAQFGHVWRPYTWWSWQPYVDGRWVWTSYGWTWVTDEPWGWTFHYGRWGFSNLYGWVWTPGYVWGPAWVDWYWGDGYVGWVPLGPPGFAIVPSYWTYVRDFSFCAPRITNVVVVHEQLPAFIVHHREQGWGTRHAPDVRDIEHVSRFRVERAADRPDRSIAPWVKHRIERGERVRERIADRGTERVIEHQGRNPTPERRNAAGDRPGPAAPERRDGWRRPTERNERGPTAPDEGRVLGHGADDGDRDRRVLGRDRGDGPVRDRGDAADQGGRPNDDLTHRRGDEVEGGGGFRRPNRGDDGRGWARPTTPQPSRPFEAPRSDTDASAPSMGSRGAGRGPTFVERRAAPSDAAAPRGGFAPRGDVTPRGEVGARGETGPRGGATGGPTMQHAHPGGAAPAGRPGAGDGTQPGVR
jgi:hypothetical protein